MALLEFRLVMSGCRSLVKLLSLLFVVASLFSGKAQAACTYGSCAPSNANIGSTVVRSASSQAAGLLSDRISQVVGGGTLFSISPSVPSPSVPTPSVPSGGVGPQTDADQFIGRGKAAGDAATPLGLWVSGAQHWLKDDQSGIAFSGTIANFVGGVDYKFDNNVLAGLGAGYEHLDIATHFNSGRMRSDGFGLSPYFGYLFNSIYSADMQFSHVWVNYDEKHGSITGSNTGERWALSTNLNANTIVDQNWLLGSSFGLFYVREFQDAFTESNGNAVGRSAPYTGEVRLKGSIGYNLQLGDIQLVPNLSARLEYDPLQSRAVVIDASGTHANNGKFGVTFGGGVRGTLGPGTSLSLDGTTAQFRPYMTDYGLSLTLRIQQ